MSTYIVKVELVGKEKIAQVESKEKILVVELGGKREVMEDEVDSGREKEQTLIKLGSKLKFKEKIKLYIFMLLF